LALAQLIPVTFALVALLLGVVGFVACYIPARRATKSGSVGGSEVRVNVRYALACRSLSKGHSMARTRQAKAYRTFENSKYITASRRTIDVRNSKQNLTYSFRTLFKNPRLHDYGRAQPLALGIGAATAIFSVVYATLFEPLPYPKSEQLMMIWSRVGSDGTNVVSPGDFPRLEETKQVISGHASVRTAPVSFNLATKDRPEQVEGGACTPASTQW